MTPATSAPRRAVFANRQRGAGLIGTLLLLVCIGFAAVVTIKAAPTYLEFREVKAAVNEARAQSTPALAREQFARSMDVNGIKSVQASDLIINSDGGGRFTVRASWEKILPLIGPMSLLIKYDTDKL